MHAVAVAAAAQIRRALVRRQHRRLIHATAAHTVVPRRAAPAFPCSRSTGILCACVQRAIFAAAATVIRSSSAARSNLLLLSRALEKIAAFYLLQSRRLPSQPTIFAAITYTTARPIHTAPHCLAAPTSSHVQRMLVSSASALTASIRTSANTSAWKHFQLKIVLFWRSELKNLFNVE